MLITHFRLVANRIFVAPTPYTGLSENSTTNKTQGYSIELSGDNELWFSAFCIQ